MIPGPPATLGTKAHGIFSSPGWSALFFGIAILFLVGVYFVWRSGSMSRLSKGAMSLILSGFSSALLYEGVAVLLNDLRVKISLTTISQWAHQGYEEDQALAGIVFLVVVLGVGVLTTAFTRVIQKAHKRGRQEGEVTSVTLVIAAVLFLVNGAVLAYWFDWLP